MQAAEFWSFERDGRDPHLLDEPAIQLLNQTSSDGDAARTMLGRGQKISDGTLCGSAWLGTELSDHST